VNTLPLDFYTRGIIRLPSLGPPGPPFLPSEQWFPWRRLTAGWRDVDACRALATAGICGAALLFLGPVTPVKVMFFLVAFHFPVFCTRSIFVPRTLKSLPSGGSFPQFQPSAPRWSAATNSSPGKIAVPFPWDPGRAGPPHVPNDELYRLPRETGYPYFLFLVFSTLFPPRKGLQCIRFFPTRNPKPPFSLASTVRSGANIPLPLATRPPRFFLQ